MFTRFFMEQDQFVLTAKLQHFFDFMLKRKDDLDLTYIEKNEPQMLHRITDLDEVLNEFKRTFEKNIYQETL